MTASLTYLYSLACDPVRSTGPFWRPSRKSAHTELPSLELVHCTASGNCSLYGLTSKWEWSWAVNSARACWITMHISYWTCPIDRRIAMPTNFFYCIKQYIFILNIFTSLVTSILVTSMFKSLRFPCQFAFIHWFVLSSVFTLSYLQCYSELGLVSLKVKYICKKWNIFMMSHKRKHKTLSWKQTYNTMKTGKRRNCHIIEEFWTGKSTASDLKYKKSKIQCTNCTIHFVSSRILKYSTEWRNGVWEGEVLSF
jgi:hypothetical protein